MPPAGGEHGWVTMNLSTPLDNHVRAGKLGRVFTAETGFLLISNPDTVRAADCALMTRERIAAAKRSSGYWVGAPNLVIEVVSPDDRTTEVADKVATWLTHDAEMVVVVDPRRRTVTVHRPAVPPLTLTDGDMLDGGDVVPGWRLPVRAIFEDD
jgi:Uma2 family endonuclease